MGTDGSIAEQERRKVVERLLCAWKVNPHLRLGQLLVRATEGVLLEYVLDEELLGLVERGLPRAERKRLAREYPLNPAA
ncbi:MAG: hypothetical protein ACE5F6_00185 [Anaerolineae bacterium]